MPGTETPQNYGSLELSRRDLLKVGILSGTAAFLAACNTEPEATGSVEKLTPTEKLFKHLGDLPDSSLKDILINHASNYFVSPTPTSVNLGGLDLAISGSEVKEDSHHVASVQGGFNARPENKIKLRYRNTKPDSLRFPLPDLIRPNDVIDPKALLSDGTPVYTISFPQNVNFDGTVFPTITITTPDASYKPNDPQQFQAIQAWTYIKEASTALVFDLWLTKAILMMKKYDLYHTLAVTDQQGKIVELNPVMDAFAKIANNGGTLTAAQDLAGYFLSFKAIQGSDLERYLTLPAFVAAISSAKKYNLGHNDMEIIGNAMRWAIDAPEARNLDHAGSFDFAP